MFEKYDVVKLKKEGLVVCGHLDYVITRVRGFWIFRSYDILAIGDNGNHIVQRVRESEIEVV